LDLYLERRHARSSPALQLDTETSKTWVFLNIQPRNEQDLDFIAEAAGTSPKISGY
jgi:hypothetical protein